MKKAQSASSAKHVEKEQDMLALHPPLQFGNEVSKAPAHEAYLVAGEATPKVTKRQMQ